MSNVDEKPRDNHIRSFSAANLFYYTSTQFRSCMYIQQGKETLFLTLPSFMNLEKVGKVAGWLYFSILCAFLSLVMFLTQSSVPPFTLPSCQSFMPAFYPVFCNPKCPLPQEFQFLYSGSLFSLQFRLPNSVKERECKSTTETGKHTYTPT